MKKKSFIILLVAAAVLLLAGCSMTTVNKMYRLPKRSDSYNNLQSVIDKAMVGLNYCAPLAGENRQTVHMADLDGDGAEECLLFAKSEQEKPLRILVFHKVDDNYVNTDTIECNGSAFDQVEYVNMDGVGLEMIVGCQLNDQVIRSATIYSLENEKLTPKASVNYTNFLTTDLDDDTYAELFVLRPGQMETDNGVAELYGMEKGTVSRYNEVTLSQPAVRVKRVIMGKLDGGKNAVYVASSVGDSSLITDVYTVIEKKLVNVTLSNEDGTSIQTMRNYYVYADDIDADGVVELPALLSMRRTNNAVDGVQHHLIRWYAMKPDGSEVNKLYTYHNFTGGWYLQLFSDLAHRTTATAVGDTVEFYIWDKHFTTSEKVMTLYTFSGQSREEQGLTDNRFILQKTDSLLYAAKLEPAAQKYELTQEYIVYSFRLIEQDWKTGET